MTRIAVCSDPHCGNKKRFGGRFAAGINARCEETLAVLSKAIVEAERARCKQLFIVGDLFDSDDVTGQVIAAVENVLMQSDMRVVVVVGNHDITTPVSRDHACAPLAHVDGLSIYDYPAVLDGGVLVVPFVKNSRGRLIDAMTEALNGYTVGAVSTVLFHAGIVDDKTPPYLQAAEDAIGIGELAEFCHEHEVKLALAGHWHTPRRFRAKGVDIRLIGALVPSGFDNLGAAGYGALRICENGVVLDTQIIPGPRFFSIPPTVHYSDLVEHLTDVGALDETGVTRCYVSWEVDVSLLDESKAALDKLKQRVAMVEGEVLPCALHQQAAAQTAAGAARDADTIDEALYEYVGKLDLPVEVDPDAVLAECRVYLGISE